VTAVFSPQRRSLRLVSGRAFFDVRHEAARPFIVNAMNVETVDIGTRFEVGLKGTDVRVILLDGRVAVTPHGAARTVLSPGEQLVARDGAAPVVSRTAGDEALSWQTGFAAFDNDTLSEAAALLNRYPGDEILVRDPRVAAMRISGNFKIGDAERFGRTLEQIYPVRVIRRSEHQIEIVAA
jgi:transmembrane sensor